MQRVALAHPFGQEADDGLCVAQQLLHTVRDECLAFHPGHRRTALRAFGELAVLPRDGHETLVARVQAALLLQQLALELLGGAPRITLGGHRRLRRTMASCLR